MNNTLSYKQIISIFRDLSIRHKMIRAFSFGSVADIKKDVDFPLLHIEPISTGLVFNEAQRNYSLIQYTFQIYVFERISRSNEDFLDVLSSTSYIINTLLIDVINHKMYRELSMQMNTDVNIDTVTHKLIHDCNGHTAEITINVPNTYTCDLPIEPITQWQTEYKNTINNYLNLGFDDFSGVYPIEYSGSGTFSLAKVLNMSGVIGGSQSIPVITYDEYGRILGITSSSFDTELPDLIVAGSIGSENSIPTITYDEKGRITSVSASTIDKNTLGLGNVDNTSDINKPVSVDQMAEIQQNVFTGYSWDKNTSTFILTSTSSNTLAVQLTDVVSKNGDGKIDNTLLPALAITDTFVVNSEAEMLNLTTAEKGDVAVRNDLTKTFILSDNNYSNINSWIELQAPTSLPDIITGGMVGNSTGIPVITYDSKGRITATSIVTPELPDVISSSTIGSSSSIPVITYDNKGRITSVATASVNIPTNAFVHGGNSFGATAILGASDNQQVYIKSGNEVRMIFGTATPFDTVAIIGDTNTGITNNALSLYNNNFTNYMRFRTSDSVIQYSPTLTIEPASSNGSLNVAVNLARSFNAGGFFIGGIANAAGTFNTQYNLLGNFGIGLGSGSYSQIPDARLLVRATSSVPYLLNITGVTGSAVFRIDNGITGSATISVASSIVPISATGSPLGLTYDIGGGTSFPFRNIYAFRYILGGQGPGIVPIAGFAESSVGRGIGLIGGLGSQNGYGVHMTPGNLTVNTGEFGIARLYGQLDDIVATGSSYTGLLVNPTLRYPNTALGIARGVYVAASGVSFSNYNYNAIETTIGNVRLITGTNGGSVVIGATQTFGTYSTKVIIRGDQNTQDMTNGWVLQAFTNSTTSTVVAGIYNAGIYSRKYLGTSGDNNYPGDLDVTRARIGNVEIGTGAGSWTGCALTSAGTNRTLNFSAAMGSLNASDSNAIGFSGQGGSVARTSGSYNVLGIGASFNPPSGTAQLSNLYLRSTILGTVSTFRGIYINDDINVSNASTLDYRGIEVNNSTNNISTTYSSLILLKSNSVERFRVDGAGNIIAGTGYSPSESNHLATKHYVDNNSSPSVLITATGGSYDAINNNVKGVVIFEASIASTSNQDFIIYNDNVTSSSCVITSLAFSGSIAPKILYNTISDGQILLKMRNDAGFPADEAFQIHFNVS